MGVEMENSNSPEGVGILGQLQVEVENLFMETTPDQPLFLALDDYIRGLELDVERVNLQENREEFVLEHGMPAYYEKRAKSMGSWNS
jgi:hypothetical protein